MVTPWLLLVWAIDSHATTCSDAYYASADLSAEGAALRRGLQAVISDPHEVIPYTSTATDVWDALKVLDADPSNASRVVEIYSGRSVASSSSGRTEGWNREHLWPKS